MDIAGYLDQALRAAGIPIISVKVGSPGDRTKWVVQFAPEATAQQRTAAQTLLLNIATDAGSIADADLALRLNADKLFRATVIWMAGKVGATPTQAKNEIVAIYKTL